MMNITDFYKRIWQAPDGHAYFGRFSDYHQDHLLDVSKLLDLFYNNTIPEEVAGDIDRLVIAYFIEATTSFKRETPHERMNEIAYPAEWIAEQIRGCIVYNGNLIRDYKLAMGLPIESDAEVYVRHKTLNGEKPQL